MLTHVIERVLKTLCEGSVSLLRIALQLLGTRRRVRGKVSDNQQRIRLRSLSFDSGKFRGQFVNGNDAFNDQIVRDGRDAPLCVARAVINFGTQ